MTTQMIVDTLPHYANPKCKIGRMVEKGEYLPIMRGLYETDPEASPYSLVNALHSPAYISFERALCEYSLIPEFVPAFCCATIDSNRTIEYETPFGYFQYQNIPAAAFHLGICIMTDYDTDYWCATPEKAVCDTLYKLPASKNVQDLVFLMFEDMRFDEDGINKLNLEDIRIMSKAYHCKNIELLCKYLARL